MFSYLDSDKLSQELFKSSGKVGWLSGSILKYIARSHYQKDIILTGFVTETDKRALISWAECSIQVGLHEGFGIPALESLAFGTIPVVSDSSSLPEVVGKAGILVNALDPEDIAKGIKRVLKMKPNKRQALKKLGQRQLTKFSWLKSARVVLKTLEKVADAD